MNWNYLAECVRLLYWSYFKPFSLAEWLSEIHPDLKSDTNPFTMQAEFRVNPKLRRYAGQVWFLTVAVPVVAAVLVGIIYSLVVEPFNWLRSSLFLMGWFLGNRAGWGKKSSREIWLTLIFTLLVFSPILINSDLLFVPEATGLFSVAFGVIYGVGFGMLSSSGMLAVAFHVALGVAFGVGFGVPSDVTLGVALGVGFSMAFDVERGVKRGAMSREALFWELMRFFSGLMIALNVMMLNVMLMAFGRNPSVASCVALGVAYILGTLRFYFWIPELLWMFFLWRFVPEGDEAKWLLRLPPHFDQIIHLPIPLMDSFIVKAYRHNPIAALKTIYYLIKSSNQQKVVLNAMVEIAIDRLNCCHNSQDIVAITEQLAWIPSPPPAELGSALPEFLAISQDVRAAENASSAYLQYEMLATPLTKLNSLGKSLVLSKNAALATSFGSAVQRWINILETSRQTLEEAAVNSAEIPQVYVAGPALNPENSSSRFKGRLDVFREIESLACSSQPPVLLLYGGRRTGKTSTLKFLPQKVGSELVPLSIDFQGAAMTTTLSGLAEFIANTIVEAARRNRNLQLPAIDKESLKTEPFLTLQKWFEQIEKNAPGKRFLLCFDEFERLEEVVRDTGSRSPLNFLRYIVQHGANWILLFSGSHTLDELNPYWNDYLINTQSLRMTYLQESEARDLIQHPIDNFPDIYTEAAIDEIIYLTRCQPYYVQLICRVLVDRLNAINRENTSLNREKQTKLAVGDVQAAIVKSLEQGGAAFRERYQELTDSEREFLHKLIEEPDLSVAESRLWQRLVEKEVLEVTGGGYRFQVPLFQKFVEMQNPG
ncbi:MAG: AAA family ATPase [Microcoleus sp. PH2017_22_RUC_O_B]|uniref:AAA family ATPase n=1 Tax=unclassified Microcoleus TaxID=2642155 RepID=UPI001DFDA064|nr:MULTISPECIES: AAA family ATPase [unclassified Microcoleus]MCC3529371.1 AAA family ATPase [Microcoleus sp. PH2017_21_RUC_O_A]MCC3541341.1 AAA family ATPase [Microcoleus sp. PH2017_22_RUC_O_B]